MEARLLVLKLIMDKFGLTPGITTSDTLQEKIKLLLENDIDLGYRFGYYGISKKPKSMSLEEDYSELIDKLVDDTSWTRYRLISIIESTIDKITGSIV